MNQLINAVYAKDFAQIRAVLASGLDINTKDSDGRTVLMHAVLDSDPDVKVIEFLLRSGCDINAQDLGQKWCALHFAARDNRKEIVSELLRWNPVVDLIDVFGNTPLWRAVMSFNGDVSVVAMLLRSGANPLKENKSGVSPKSLAETIGKSGLLDLFESS